MKNWIFLLTSLTFGPICMGQDMMSIVDPSAIVPHAELAKDPLAKAGLQAAGLDEAAMGEVLTLSDERHWPDGLRTDSARAVNANAIRNYAVRRVCEYATDEGPLTIVAVRALENLHMPEELRSRNDLYLVMRNGGLQALEKDSQRPAPSRGPVWRNLPTAVIIKPDDLFATYDLASDSLALAALEEQGLSRPEIEAVIFRSHERNWPDGIDSFDERYPRLAEMKKYKARLLARCGEKVILVVPAELNRKAPSGLRPFMDIYLVYSTSAVQVRSKRK